MIKGWFLYHVSLFFFGTSLPISDHFLPFRSFAGPLVKQVPRKPLRAMDVEGLLTARDDQSRIAQTVIHISADLVIFT